MLVAGQVRRYQPVLAKHFVQQNPSPGAQGTVRPAHAKAMHVMQAFQIKRVAVGHDQALHPGCKANDLVQSRLQKWLIGSRRQ